MPNIEVYGITGERTIDIEKKIHGLFETKPYAADYVITFIASGVVDKDGNNQPFLRLVSTPNAHLDDILLELQKLNMDIEVQMLKQFIPKKI
ncbi:MAG: hypothetical protein WCV41_01785 [Patescibacteria group bacterium]